MGMMNLARRRPGRVVFHCVLVFFLMSMVIGGIVAMPKATSAAVAIPFNTRSIWNQPIPANPALVSNSSQMIQNLTSTPDRSQIILPGVHQYWSVPVYETDASTPRYTVTDMYGYSVSNVPIPNGVLLDPTSDSKIVLIDRTVSPARAYSFWAFERSGSGYTAGSTGWGDITTNGDGIHNFDGGRWGGRATGWNYLGGLITPDEIRQGHIDHALVMSVDPAIVSPTGVWPAMQADGYSSSSDALREGGRIQLDPSIDVNSLNLTPGGKVIARALQVYGAWMGDTGGSTAIYAQEFLKPGTNGAPTLDQSPWQGLLDGSDLNNFPVNRLRVVQANESDFYVNNSWAPSTVATPTPTATNTPAPTATPQPGTATPTPTPSIAPFSGNLLTNPGFEGGVISPWRSWQGSVSITNDARSGTAAGKVTYVGGTTAGMFSVDDGPPGQVANPPSGTTYNGSVWVKGLGSSVGKTVRLVMRASNSTAEYETRSSDLVLSSGWQQLSATHTIANTGMTGLDIYVVQFGAGAGDALVVDDFSVSNASSSIATPTPTPSPAPSPSPTPTPASSPSPTPSPTASPSPSVTPTPGVNLLSNPGFESGISPWASWQGKISLSSDAHSGSRSASVAFVSGSTPPTYTIGNGPPGEVTDPPVGARYEATAWVKGAGSSIGKQVRLVIRDSKGNTQHETAGPWVALSSGWQQISVTHTISKAGMTGLDIYVVQTKAAGSDSFLVDDLSLYRK